MKLMERSVQVDAAAEVVFAVLADLRRRPEWVTSTIRTFDIPPGPLRAGATFRQVMRVAGIPMESLWSVVLVDRPCRLAYEVMCPAGGSLSMTQRLSSLGDATVVTVAVEYELPDDLLPGSLSPRYIERRIQREMAGSLHNLRDLIEDPDFNRLT